MTHVSETGNTAESPVVDRQEFLAAIGMVTSTVTIVTARSAEGHRAGMTATAVCSLSDSPPMLLVCLNKKTTTLAAVKDGGNFTVNFLADDQAEVAGKFARHADTPADADAAFDEGTWTNAAGGMIALTGALAACHCQVRDMHDAGTHLIVTGEVIHVVQAADAGPLLYGQQAFQRRPEKI